MRHFNLVKSLSTRVNNITSLPFRKGLGLGRLLILCLSLVVFGVNEAWGVSKTKLTVNIVGGGKVAITRDNTAPSSYSSSSVEDNQSHGGFDVGKTDTYYIWLQPNTGFSGTCSINDTKDASITGNGTNSYKVTIKGSTFTTERTVTVTFKATFYGKAKAYADPAAGGGTWISLNGNWPTSDENYKAEDNSTKNENTTAAPTFSAQYDAKVKDGYEFVGWYTANNGGGTKKSSTVRYTEAFTASSVDQNAPTTIIRYAYFKALQYYYFKAQAGKVGAGNVYASFSDGSYSATSDIKTERATTLAQTQSTGTYTAYFKAEETDAAYHFAGWYSDAECTDANRVSKNLTYSVQMSGSTATTEATAKTTTLYAKFVQELTPEVTANYSGSPKAMFVDDEINTAFSFLNTSKIGSGLSVVSSNDNIIVYDAANNKVIAKNEGTATLTFTQTKQDIIKAGEFSFTFTVSKIANTLSVANGSPTMYVGDNLVDKISTNSDATINVSSNDETVAHYDLGSQTIIAQNIGNQSFNSKEVTITISQAETYKYTAAEKTITVTVKKHIPTFTWSNATLYHNQTYNDFFTTNCSNTLTVKSSSDDNVAYLVDGANAQKLNLKTLTKAASTTLTVTQAENYYWAEHTESKTITPSVAPNHVPFTYNEAMFNDPNVTTQKVSGTGMSWRGYVRLGGDGTSIASAEGYDFEDKYVVIRFEGIPDKVSFEYSESSSMATKEKWSIEESSDGSNWSNVWETSNDDNGTSWTAVGAQQLSKNTRYLRLKYHGNFAGEFKNVTVTELKTFSVNKTELDFGSNKKDIACASQTLTFNYANVGHKVTLTPSDSHFTVSPTSITNIGGEKYGSQTITVSYSTAEVHSATDAKLTIKDELGNTKEVTLKGTTTKKAQTLKWEKPYDVEEPAIPIGKTITGAATSSANLGITYESSDETIIEIVNDGKAFKALTTGSATITAKQVGTEDWEAASISKVFKTTNKIIQVISWNQNFTRLLTNYGTQSLTAIVNLENAETGEQTYSKERSDLITYTSQNTSVVSVNGSTLTIVGKGETTLTATVPGDDLYESATVTIPVKVREPSAGCEDVLLGNDFGSGEYEFFHYSLTSDMEKVVKIDRTTSAIPGVLSFQHKGKKWGLNYSGEIVVYESTNNGQSWTKLGEITPTVDKYNTQPYPLSRNATHIKFFRGKSATGYHYIKNVEISPAQFIESNISGSTIDFGVISVNSVETKDFSLKYANVKDNLSVSKSSSDISLSCGDIIDLDCGATGTIPITITFSPKVVGDFSDDIQFLDKNSGKNYTLKITAKVEKSTQHITWNPSKTEYRTIDKIELDATASSNNPVQYYVKDGKDIADFVNGVLTIKKDGQITIRAHEPGDALWAPAVDVDKTFTIRKTNLHFNPLPKAATITYPQTLSESALTDGVVKDEDGNVVAGTIAWTNPATQLNAGENQSQGIIFTPAANPAWYNALSSSVPVPVQKAEPDAIAHASEIIYGAVVGTSILTNEGTTNGIWTWTDIQKEQVLEVGTHEGLKVHFIPTDQTNYNEIDGTVSLMVTAATPTLEWTEKAETAQVHETKTFTASSTNTDNTAAITYSITSGTDYATIDASTGEVTMLKAGKITVQASQAATTNFAAPSAITTTCTISKAPTVITTNPEIDGDIIYGAQLTDLKLKANTGAARNTVNQQPVEGTFSITGGDLSTAGEKTITVTFTPANTDMYASCTSNISVTVQKKESDAIAHAGEIIYGAVVGTSILTNEGTTAGIWTWTDIQKEQVLEVGTHEGLKVHFTPTDQTNYNEIDGTVSLTVKKATATLTWTNEPTSADVKEKLTYTATSNHSESAIIYAITSGADCATIDANTGELTITKAGTITIQASQDASAHYEAATAITVTTTLTGEFENVFSGDGDWNDPENWTYGVPTSDNPNIVVSGSLTISKPISVGGLTIEANGKVTIVGNGDLTVNGTSGDRETYGDLFVHNGGIATIGNDASLTVNNFVIETSIGTEGQSASGQVHNESNIIYTTGAYIDINMDPHDIMEDAQWYGFTVPFPVDVQNGVARKEGDVFRKCIYGTNYMICEYDMNQRLNTGKGWKYIKSGHLLPGHFYYFTAEVPDYNVYSFKAAENKITINNTTELLVNGEGANANWNAVGNSTLTYATISGENVPAYVQTYVNGESRYITVATSEAQFVVGCPFFFQASKEATMILNEANKTIDAHYAPRQESVDKPVCVRIAEEGKHFSDQIYLTASQEATGEYTLGRDLAKAGIGTKSAQLWMNAYGQKLSVQDATLMGDQAYYELSIYAPTAGSYELSLPKVPANAVIYLTQNGYPIWNLNETPYVIECYKGTTNEYGLLLRLQEGGSPTDMQTMRGSEKVQKIMKDQRIYINANTQLYDLMGQKVK